MPVPAGAYTPWARVRDDLWYCPVSSVGSGSDLLAEALRVSGLVRTASIAFRAAEDATLVQGYVGLIDGDDEPQVCDPTGYTQDGHAVEWSMPVIFALLDRATLES